MNRQFQILLLILFPVLSIFQETNSLKKSDFLFGVNAGLNVCKFDKINYNFGYGSKPSIGLYSKHKLNDKYYLYPSIQYSLRGSGSENPDFKMENQYLDLNCLVQYRVSNQFYLQSGLSYFGLLASNEIVNQGGNWTGMERRSIEGFTSEFHLPVGFEFKLQNNVNLGFNYYIPTGSSNASCFQFSISVLFYNREGKEQSYRKIKRIASEQQIQQLKEGTLLVRLSTSENKIEYLREVGENTRADIVKNNQDIENKEIISSFNKELNFCDVAFFYSNKTKEVGERVFDRIFINKKN
ncbi:MAG: outer membrane beta-barrel protein [Bacteroidales bacterium]|nr:outer membrane beta-barrel protein [Bacteroidales bacterium]